jgi:hypothetical protein
MLEYCLADSEVDHARQVEVSDVATDYVVVSAGRRLPKFIRVDVDTDHT